MFLKSDGKKHLFIWHQNYLSDLNQCSNFPLNRNNNKAVFIAEYSYISSFIVTIKILNKRERVCEHYVKPKHLCILLFGKFKKYYVK